MSELWDNIQSAGCDEEGVVVSSELSGTTPWSEGRVDQEAKKAWLDCISCTLQVPLPLLLLAQRSVRHRLKVSSFTPISRPFDLLWSMLVFESI